MFIVSKVEERVPTIMCIRVGIEVCTRSSGKWNAQIQYNGKKLVSLVCGDEIVLGDFSSEEEAARAYDIAARRYHGSKAILNFQTSESGSQFGIPFR